MNMKQYACTLFSFTNKKFEEQFGWPMRETTLSKVTDYLHSPKDPSSLAVTRILFGLAMLFDIPDERGGADLERRWGDPLTCHFPLFPFLRALPMPYMAIVYACLWLGALGIMLGYKYRVSATTFAVCYWYLLLIEKSYWNNHSYLFGLVGLLLACTEANCYWSVDAYLDPSIRKPTVPYWNYFVLKFQFFILYFMAGLKKGTAEWLTGYSVQNLSEHWVFAPFKLFLTTAQTDYLIVHWFIFIFDLTVAVWMMCAKSRHVAMVFCALFHLMNSRLFRIGMFPWVCLATMPLFYPFDWPKLSLTFCKKYLTKTIQEIRKLFGLAPTEHECHCQLNNSDNEDEQQKPIVEMIQDLKGEDSTTELKDNSDEEVNTNTKKEIVDNAVATIIETNCERRKLTTVIIALYVFSQLFLPYSHFITKGFNNWTDGLYGYSWDMMVHTWDTHSIIVKVVDNERKSEFFVDPTSYTLNDRWTRHGDMVYQYAKCLKENLMEESYRRNRYRPMISDNISIFVDVWCSMNGRLAQRMFDPKVDLLKANWHPFARIPYLMPLLDEALGWRNYLDDMKKVVQEWNNYSDVIFLADFSGYELEKYIPQELNNVTLTILEGKVVFEPEVTNAQNGQSYQLLSGNKTKVKSGSFHKLFNIGDKPAYYMYTFYNSTEEELMVSEKPKSQPMLPIGRELWHRLKNMATFGRSVIENILEMVFQVSRCQ
ncbi:vitamin K-dependent gamma-carboxylase isoform X1 [Amyelois transitella]|uniref:vitamin K-dependent gamma-carboxylase isoform X1 n=3 Tax=Amyelois transitella TaxID=680683 RepID=UPI0029906884|nr:vitamin K-dependent gamma-carboxylase isoform X1 [Amyelois transitella]XP_060801298.1 vitamin K-dependent gamma-carboxylase isoform X1 [Amyelois transitella]